MKKPFLTRDQAESIAASYPTPFHIYDEKGIRENARRVKEAFSWNPGFKEYFAVKATPTPGILKVLRRGLLLPDRADDVGKVRFFRQRHHVLLQRDASGGI